MAEWTADYVKSLPDSSFLLVQAGRKNTGGEMLRLFPVRDEKGQVNVAQLREAITQIPKSGLDAATIKQLQTAARRALIEGSGSKALSFSDIGGAVRDAIYSVSPEGQRRAAEGYEERDWWYTEEIFPGYAIVRTKSGYFKVGYTLNSDTNQVSLAPRSEWKLVKQEWVEITA